MVPEIKDFEEFIDETTIKYENKSPDVQECAVSIQREDYIKKEISHAELPPFVLLK